MHHTTLTKLTLPFALLLLGSGCSGDGSMGGTGGAGVGGAITGGSSSGGSSSGGGFATGGATGGTGAGTGGATGGTGNSGGATGGTAGTGGATGGTAGTGGATGGTAGTGGATGGTAGTGGATGGTAGTGGAGATGGTAGTGGASSALSFGTDVYPILQTNCATGKCHFGTPASAGLSFADETTAFTNLTTMMSTTASAAYVVSGDPANSYLVKKLEGTGMGGRMPAGGAQPLMDGDMMTIEQWITDGAAP